MASPPHISGSPPYPSHATLPSKKRPSISTADVNPSKRRKPSLASATSGLHPLRQTSFPPEAALITSQDGYARSPSVDSSFTALTGTGSAPKVRGRKPRGGDARSVTEGSTRGGRPRKPSTRTNSVVTGKVGRPRKAAVAAAAAAAGEDAAVTAGGTRAEVDEEDEEDEGDLGASMTLNGADQIDEDQERKKLA